MRSLSAALLAGVVLASGLQAQADPAAPAGLRSYKVDKSHTTIGFRVRHLGISWVHGSFGDYDVTFDYDATDPARSRVEATIQAASVTTNNERRDRDLRANYLTVDSFPTLSFVSHKVEPEAGDHLKVSGDLTIRGVTRPVVLDAELGGARTFGKFYRVAFSASTAVKRQDFGMTRNAFIEGVGAVGDSVQITIDLEASTDLSSGT